VSEKRICRLWGPTARTLAASLCRELPDGWIVEFKAPTRTLEQNARLWSMLTDLSEQVEWYGKKLTPDDWKDVCSASLRKARVVPTIDGDGFVPLGMRTSSMTKAEFGALMDLIDAFGAERGVTFRVNEAPVRLEARR
jgi:hypothetical protein